MKSKITLMSVVAASLMAAATAASAQGYPTAGYPTGPTGGMTGGWAGPPAQAVPPSYYGGAYGAYGAYDYYGGAPTTRGWRQNHPTPHSTQGDVGPDGNNNGTLTGRYLYNW